MVSGVDDSVSFTSENNKKPWKNSENGAASGSASVPVSAAAATALRHQITPTEEQAQYVGENSPALLTEEKLNAAEEDKLDQPAMET